MCSEVAVLLTLTGDVVGRWKEYLEALFNPTNIEAESGNLVKMLQNARPPEMDEIHSEFLKTLDVVGLSWFDTIQHYL